MLGTAVLALLMVLCALILLPGAVRSRRPGSSLSSIDDFERSLGMLAPSRISAGTRPASGRHVLVLEHPSRVTGGRIVRSRTLARRRAVLVRLIAAVPVSAILALVIGGIFKWVLAASLVGLAGYVILLAQLRTQELEARRKVHHLRPRPVPVRVRADAGQRRRVG